jgi:hypothetical protein
MLKIYCPLCKKSFFWTDEMPVQGKCQNPDCEWNYDIHSVLRQNIARHTAAAEKKTGRCCPSCGEKIPFIFTICRHCNHVVLGTKFFRKKYFFLGVCVFLIGSSLILKYLVK